MENMEILYADSVDAAIDKIDQGHVDILISEIKNEIMDGEEFFHYVRMVSEKTIKIAMTTVTDARETLEKLNQMDAFRLILKPVNVLEDIMTPVEEAIQKQKELCQDISFPNSLQEDTEEYRASLDKINKEVGAKQSELRNRMNIVLGLSNFNLHGKKEKNSEFDSDMILRFYNLTLRNHLKYMMFEVNDRKVIETSLLNEFNDENTGNTLDLSYEIPDSISEELLRKSAFLVSALSNLVDQLLVKYHITVVLEKNEDTKNIELKFFCDLKDSSNENGELIFKEKDHEIQKILFSMTRELLKKYGTHSALGVKGNPFVAKVIFA